MIDQLTKRYEKEAERIELIRLETWSSVGVEYELCGFPCVPLTLQAWIDLKAARNALLTDRPLTIGNLAAYIWRNHCEYKFRATDKSKEVRHSIIKRVSKMNLIEVATEAIDHLETAFSELPENANLKGKTKRESGFPAVMDVVYAIDEIASRYGMHPDDVLKMPMLKIFHLQKAIRSITNPDFKAAKPDSLRKIDGEILEALNNAKG